MPIAGSFLTSSDRPRTIVALAVSAASVALVCSLIWKMDRGFDFTDQAFYLMLAQRPAEYELVLGLFSYALHPLYLLAGGSVSAFNRIGAFILAGSGFLLGWAVLANLKRSNLQLSWRDPDAILILGSAVVAPFFYYAYWLPTPSYNWLALVAGLLLALALILVQIRPTVSALAAALALTVALFTRPQNVAAYVGIYLLGFLCALPDQRARWMQVGRTALFGLGFLAVLAALLPFKTILSQIDGYFVVFGGSHPNPFSVLDQQLDFLRTGLIWFVSGALLLVCMFARHTGRTDVGKIGAITAFAILLLLAGAYLPRRFYAGSCQVVSVLGASGFAMLSIACRRDAISLKLIAILALIGLIPWAATLGSAGRVCFQFDFFSGLSLIVLVVVTALVLPRSYGVAFVSLVGLYLAYRATAYGLASPYRLAAPLGLQTVSTELGSGAVLKLDERTRQFVERLRSDVASRGFCRGDLAIDVSGEIPGAVFAIGGRMPVFPWIFAGYASTHRFAGEYLRMVGPERLGRAWLIVSTGSEIVTKQEWEGLGLDLASRVLVDRLTHPATGSGLELYAPAVERGPC
jgi:hypothetical protein